MALSKQQREAIKHIAIGENDAETARIIGVNPITLVRWRKNEEFIEALAAAVNTAMERFDQAVGDLADDLLSVNMITSKKHRVEALGLVRDKLFEVIRERAEWFEKNKPDVPGGKTGLIAEKQSGLATNYVLDSQLIAKLVEVQAAASKELGQDKDQPKNTTKLYDKVPIDDI